MLTSKSRQVLGPTNGMIRSEHRMQGTISVISVSEYTMHFLGVEHSIHEAIGAKPEHSKSNRVDICCLPVELARNRSVSPSIISEPSDKYVLHSAGHAHCIGTGTTFVVTDVERESYSGSILLPSVLLVHIF